jgi:hypothetical protein
MCMCMRGVCVSVRCMRGMLVCVCARVRGVCTCVLELSRDEVSRVLF